MSFPVLYDACVLHPAPLRDFLVRVARTRLVQAHWTNKILDECFTSILESRNDLTAAKLERTRQLMNAAIPDVLVEGYESLLNGLALPDPDDVHVLAAAIKAKVEVIVTFNLKDFPESALQTYDIEAQHPDDFVRGLIDLAPGTICNVVQAQAAALKSPTQTVGELLDTLARNALVQSVAEIRKLLGGNPL